MKKIFLTLIALLITLLPLAAVQSHAEMQMESLIRIVHASPDASAVDIYINDEQVVSGIVFADATDYLSVPEGSNSVEIYEAGTKGEKDPLISASVNVQGGMAYTVVAANTLQQLELEVLKDDMEVANGKAKIRVSHFSPDAPAVNVGLQGGDVLFNNLAFKQTSDYKELEPNIYDLAIATADGQQQILDLSDTELAENTIYNVLAINTADNLEVLMLEDQSVMPPEITMPSEMPKTGMGGTASTYSFENLIYASAGAVILVFIALAFRRYRA
ncbi:hypothetical protein J2S09_003025 [Bacillus fengqiuensis]|nr:hypothetical protein [Bacillus fengqiuensis]